MSDRHDWWKDDPEAVEQPRPAPPRQPQTVGQTAVGVAGGILLVIALFVGIPIVLGFLLLLLVLLGA